MSARVTDAFKQQRPGQQAQAPAAHDKAARPGKAPAAAAAAAAPGSSSGEEAELALRRFDLNSKYGPCAGATRLERWQRAAALGLDPPREVPELIERYGGEASQYNANLWDHAD